MYGDIPQEVSAVTIQYKGVNIVPRLLVSQQCHVDDAPDSFSEVQRRIQINVYHNCHISHATKPWCNTLHLQCLEGATMLDV